MYNCRIINAIIVDAYDILIVAYIAKIKSKLTLKFYNYDLTEIKIFDVDPIFNVGLGVFYKILLCQDDYLAGMFL